jgi:hypothetical protein
MGLSRQFAARVYALRRQLEAQAVERFGSEVPLIVVGHVRTACLARATVLRGNIALESDAKGKEKLTPSEKGTLENRIVNANRREEKAITALTAACQDDWQLYANGLRQLDVAPQRAIDTVRDSGPAEVPVVEPSPPTIPASVSDSQSDALSAKTPQNTAFPEGSGCQSPVVSETPVQAKNDATSFRKPRKVKKPKKPVEKVAEPPAKVKEAAPAVEEKPSWMPPEPGDWFSEMCAHYGRLGFHPFPIGKNERGEFVFAKLPQARPVPQLQDDPNFWCDGTPKRRYQM